jgi:hypothetical protein
VGIKDKNKDKNGKKDKNSNKKTSTEDTKTLTAPKKRTKSRNSNDDTPRAFRRLMAAAQGKKLRSGLDDGTDGNKPNKNEPAPDAPKIRPGEDLRAFAARVDASLPVSGLTRKTAVKDGKDEQGVKVWRTRKELKMHRLYDQWRAEDRKAKERREGELELEAEKELENDAAGITSSAAARILQDFEGDEAGKKKKKGKGKKGRSSDDDDDPWLELKKKRGEAKIGLHDVAQAPPELNKKKSRQLKVTDGAGVDVEGIPKAAGSLRRREELQKERNDVLEAYRKIREHEQAKLTGSSR